MQATECCWRPYYGATSSGQVFRSGGPALRHRGEITGAIPVDMREVSQGIPRLAYLILGITPEILAKAIVHPIFHTTIKMTLK